MRPWSFHRKQACLEDVAARVVEVDVDPLRARRPQLSLEFGASVVDGGVEPELTGEPRALLLAAGDSNHATTLDPGDLPHDRPHRSRGRRHDHGVARLGLSAFQEAEIGREARDPVHAQQVCLGPEVREFANTSGRERGIVLPAGVGEHEIPGLQVVGIGFNDFRNPAPRHHLPALQGGTIGRALHPGPVGGVQRDVAGLQQHLSLARRRSLAAPEREMLGREPLGAGEPLQHDLTIAHCVILSFSSRRRR